MYSYYYSKIEINDEMLDNFEYNIDYNMFLI